MNQTVILVLVLAVAGIAAYFVLGSGGSSSRGALTGGAENVSGGDGQTEGSRIAGSIAGAIPGTLAGIASIIGSVGTAAGNAAGGAAGGLVK